MTEITSEGGDWDVDIRRAYGKKHIDNTEPGKDGWLGNPHIATEGISRHNNCPYCDRQHTREEAIELFETLLRNKLSTDKEFQEKFKELRGKTLRTDCSEDEHCHGDVIIEILEERENNSEGCSPS